MGLKYDDAADLFEVDADIIINPVNCQIHKLHDRQKAQQGLAGDFERRFPGIQEDLVRVCRTGALKPGYVYLLGVDRKTGMRAPKETADLFIANIATKDYWADPSKIEWIDRGLAQLAKAVESRGFKSVAIPKLGAGRGKLPWDEVRERVETHFGKLAKKGVNVVVLGQGPTVSRSTSKPARQVQEPLPENYAEGLYFAGIGARETPEHELKRLKAVSKNLAKRGWILRSGAAKGADSYCEEGFDEVGGKKEIFLPWDGFDPLRNGNKRWANGKDVIAGEVTKGQLDLAQKFHPKWNSLSSGAKQMMARNCNQMLGRDLQTPSKVVLCWTERGQIVGGTGQALRMAKEMGVQVVNLGDPRLQKLSTDAIARVVVAASQGKQVNDAITAEQARAKRQKEPAR